MISFDLGYVATGKANRQIARLWLAALQCRHKRIPAHRVIHDIHSAKRFDNANHIFARAVDRNVSTAFSTSIKLILSTGHCDDPSAQSGANFNRCQADSAGGAQY